jgi:hypothetical protein
MRPPPERKSPALLTPGCDRNLVRGIDQSETYAETVEVSTAAAIIPFRAHGRTVRAICIVPCGTEAGDQCRSVTLGQPMHDGLDRAFTGPLWRVQMMVEQDRRGLPIYVHSDCLRRAGQPPHPSASASVIAWPRVPLRAFVVVPDDEPTRDLCRVMPAGLEIDGEAPLTRSDLRGVLWALRADPRGLPVTVIEECERRAAQ